MMENSWIFEFSARKMGTKTWCVDIFVQCMPIFSQGGHIITPPLKLSKIG